jgi:hypothetical protein
MISQAVCVCKTIENLSRWIFAGRSDDHERAPSAAGFVARCSVEGTVTVQPQHLHLAEAALRVLRFRTYLAAAAIAGAQVPAPQRR